MNRDPEQRETKGGESPPFTYKLSLFPAPTFSIIIPVRPGGTVAALDALRRLDETYPFEVLVVEGKTPSQQRNQAAYLAQGDFLYFLDDDSIVPQDAFSWAAAAFEERVVAVVGGPSLTPESDTRLQHLFGYALSSPFGAGGVRNRYRAVGLPRETTEQELILCNMAFRREDFISFGGFNERLYPNEENELLDRIAGSGRKLVHVPEMGVLRSQRSSLEAFMRQMYSYGRGRAQQTIIAGVSSPISFVPLLFLLYLVTTPLSMLSPLWLLPLALYLLLAALFALIAAVSSHSLSAFKLIPLFPLLHCCNGIGLLSGFISGKPLPVARGVVTVKQLKTFNQKDW